MSDPGGAFLCTCARRRQVLTFLLGMRCFWSRDDFISDTCYREKKLSQAADEAGVHQTNESMQRCRSVILKGPLIRFSLLFPNIHESSEQFQAPVYR